MTATSMSALSSSNAVSESTRSNEGSYFILTPKEIVLNNLVQTTVFKAKKLGELVLEDVTAYNFSQNENPWGRDIHKSDICRSNEMIACPSETQSKVIGLEEYVRLYRKTVGVSARDNENDENAIIAYLQDKTCTKTFYFIESLPGKVKRTFECLGTSTDSEKKSLLHHD